MPSGGFLYCSLLSVIKECIKGTEVVEYVKGLFWEGVVSMKVANNRLKTNDSDVCKGVYFSMYWKILWKKYLPPTNNISHNFFAVFYALVINAKAERFFSYSLF